MLKLFHAARESFELRRANRAERGKLERELAGYISHRDRVELEAILERYPFEETKELWAILDRYPLDDTRGLWAIPSAQRL